MDKEKKRKFQKAMTVLGGMLMLMPNGLMWFWGNIAAYSLSYIAVCLGTTSALTAPWMTSLFVISWISSLALSNFVSKIVTRRWTLFAGMITGNFAVFASYFAVQKSLMALNVTFGMCLGLGTGLIYGSSMQLVIGCADTDVGLLSSLLQGAFAAGAIVTTQFLTWYTNPRNLAPTLEIDQALYFTQKELLDRVPSMFLAFGFGAMSVQSVGFVLLQFNPSIGLKSSTNPEEKPLKEDDNDIELKEMTEANRLAGKCLVGKCSLENSHASKKDHESYSPRRVLQRSVFYILWLSFFIGDIPYVLLTNYYKIYGQIWIQDDHFLANLGTTLVGVSFGMRFVWGYAMDTYGIKNSFLIIISCLTLIMAWFYFTAIIDRWLYFAATLVYGSFGSCLYGCFMAATAIFFGKQHVSTNYAMLLTSSVVLNVLAPFVVEAALTSFGWFYLFASASALSLGNLILCATAIPQI